jgi:pyrroloquinoline quinone (PQQ) biosynthesis protein C
MAGSGDDILDYIIDTSMEAAQDWRFFSEPLTLGRGRAWLLQHVLRNRFYSAVMRPAWVSRCPDLALVHKTIGQMREELVYDDEIKAAHTALLWQFGRNLGLTDEQMNTVRAEPLAGIFFNTLENVARTRHWLLGWLGSSLAEFVSFKAGDILSADNWKKALGLSEEEVFFFRYHEHADLEHAGKKTWEPMRKWASDDGVRQELVDGLPILLAAHGCYYEAVARLGEKLDRELSR